MESKVTVSKPEARSLRHACNVSDCKENHTLVVDLGYSVTRLCEAHALEVVSKVAAALVTKHY